MKRLLLLACLLAITVDGRASDHGPVFGYATPVNSQYEWSFDTGLFGRTDRIGRSSLREARSAMD
jgi:hypothetical protein